MASFELTTVKLGGQTGLLYFFVLHFCLVAGTMIKDVESGMTDWGHQFISEQRGARMGTVDANSQPSVIPIVYAFDGVSLFTPLDAKPKRAPASQLQRVRNININPSVAVIIDNYSEDWRSLAWVHVRGLARVITGGDAYAAG